MIKKKEKKRSKSFDEEKVNQWKYEDIISPEELYHRPFENCMILKLQSSHPPEIDEDIISYAGYYSFLNKREERVSWKKIRDNLV
jgi:hypothetical protein